MLLCLIFYLYINLYINDTLSGHMKSLETLGYNLEAY